MAGTLHIRTLFIFRGNRLEIPVLYHSFKGMQEYLALVDSGAMENFMDHTTVKKLRLGTKKLKYPIPVRNIDGSNNRAGHIMDFIELIIKQGTKKVPTKFYITNLGSDRAILGYPWLRDFNPDIDWPTGKLNGPLENSMAHKLKSKPHSTPGSPQYATSWKNVQKVPYQP
jgi:hypothetical protein